MTILLTSLRKLWAVFGRISPYARVLIMFAVFIGLTAASFGLSQHAIGSLNHVVVQQHKTVGRLNKTVGRLNKVVAQQHATVLKLRREVSAECSFNYDLAGLPVTVNPATRQASLLGVKIVSDVRGAWYTAGCMGTIPPPSPSLVKWARFYRIRIR